MSSSKMLIAESGLVDNDDNVLSEEEAMNLVESFMEAMID